jgi:hypothetical protein
MKRKTTITIICFIQVLFFQSCKAQDIDFENNTIEIINLLLPKNDSICLFKESYYTGDRKNPKSLIDDYFRVYNSKKNTASYELFYKGKDSLIYIDELNEMKTRYTAWSLREWKQPEIKNKNVHLISITDKGNKCRKIYRISEPLYTEDNMKAIIKVHSSVNNSGGTVLTILKKEKGKWKIIGGIPIGTSG